MTLLRKKILPLGSSFSVCQAQLSARKKSVSTTGTSRAMSSTVAAVLLRDTSSGEIDVTLAISRHTPKTDVPALLKRNGPRNRSELVAKLLRRS
jgi:DNA-binding CsgD family transcriptional regulator